ncbi:Mitochondrial inner membrane protease atp23 [Coemansia sp. RSA 1646]|nr:Mitochondrial inner membrane protease atp23 [Coemansia sp. RSA 1646]
MLNIKVKSFIFRIFRHRRGNGKSAVEKATRISANNIGGFLVAEITTGPLPSGTTVTTVTLSPSSAMITTISTYGLDGSLTSTATTIIDSPAAAKARASFVPPLPVSSKLSQHGCTCEMLSCGIPNEPTAQTFDRQQDTTVASSKDTRDMSVCMDDTLNKLEAPAVRTADAGICTDDLLQTGKEVKSMVISNNDSTDDKSQKYKEQYLAMDAEERKAFGVWSQAIRALGWGLSDKEKKEQQELKEYKQDVKNCTRCEKWRNELLKTSPIVRFMSEHLHKSGFPLSPENMPCIKCEEMRSGGFAEDGTIQLCYNRLFGKGHLETTMAHEMVHAYDQANFDIDWYNLEHHACTEIRAASLSGDCTWFQETMRGNVGFLKHHQVCVKRRAVLSLLANPSCKSKKHAEAAVNKVFQSCFTDTRPFDEIY